MIKHDTDFRYLKSLSWGLKQIIIDGALSRGKTPASLDIQKTDKSSGHFKSLINFYSGQVLFFFKANDRPLNVTANVLRLIKFLHNKNVKIILSFAW